MSLPLRPSHSPASLSLADELRHSLTNRDWALVSFFLDLGAAHLPHGSAAGIDPLQERRVLLPVPQVLAHARTSERLLNVAAGEGLLPAAIARACGDLVRKLLERLTILSE